MGVIDIPACQQKNTMYYLNKIIYIIAFFVFLTVGILYEVDVIPRKQFEKDSIWWYGVIGLVVIGFGVIILNRIFSYINRHFKINEIENYIWNITHFIAYLSLVLLSPGQWAFWLATGILWELFECYTFCWPNGVISCSGYYDILANLCGIAVGMWIKSQQNM